MKELGMAGLEFLGYVDGEVDQENPAEIIGKIVSHILSIQPQVVVTFPPDGNYGHPDHIAIGQFTIAALVCAADASYQDPERLPAHRVLKLYYVVDSERFVNLIAPFMGDMTFLVDDQLCGEVAWKEWMITTRIDMAEHCEAAWRAIQCHQSQLPSLGMLTEMHEDAARAVLAMVERDNQGEKEKLLLARSLVEKVFHGEEVKTLETIKGRKLNGVKYHPLYSFMPPDKPAHYVVLGDFVTTEDGSGIVHMAPAFGAEDMDMARQHNLPVLMTVLRDGTFVPEVTPWRGVFVKEADPMIIQDLDARGLLFKSEPYTHTYPFCWRCGTPLLYYARESWYIRTSAHRDRLVLHPRDRRPGKVPFENTNDGYDGRFLKLPK